MNSITLEPTSLSVEPLIMTISPLISTSKLWVVVISTTTSSPVYLLICSTNEIVRNSPKSLVAEIVKGIGSSYTAITSVLKSQILAPESGWSATLITIVIN